jgi:hypothetical protein
MELQLQLYTSPQVDDTGCGLEPELKPKMVHFHFCIGAIPILTGPKTNNSLSQKRNVVAEH